MGRACFVMLCAALGCAASSEFVCEADKDCRSAQGQGECEDIGYCSFPDADCASGARFGEHAGDGLAGACVEEPVESNDAGDSPPASCGNGVLDDGEVCDGQDFGELDCQALGFGSGDLQCTNNCDEVISTQCAPVDCREEGEPCSGPTDCCNSGCGKNGSSCIFNNVEVCCS